MPEKNMNRGQGSIRSVVEPANNLSDGSSCGMTSSFNIVYRLKSHKNPITECKFLAAQNVLITRYVTQFTRHPVCGEGTNLVVLKDYSHFEQG